jgi:hypothetical protein
MLLSSLKKQYEQAGVTTEVYHFYCNGWSGIGDGQY